MGIKVEDIKIGNKKVVAGAVNLPFLKGDAGKEGARGQQGIGIKSVEQIVTSTEDNGINIIEVTLENESKSIFEVRNGSRGDGQGGSYDDTEIKKELQNKVDKVTGKSLILDSEIQRLSNVKNYDDTAIRQLIYNNLIEAKQYTDTEIANFDFVKIVASLPTQGLPNKVYFVPKEESETNNIFEEYAWINGAWESFGTKIVEVDLTDINTDIEKLQKNKADKTELPTRLSDLENDKGFITEEDIPTSDGILTGSVIGYTGETIPEGYEEVENDGGIETITNSNGTAVKFPDGTMIFTVTKKIYDMAINNQYGQFYISTPYAVPYAVPFANIPTVTCNTLQYGTSSSWGNASGANKNEGYIRGFDAYSRASGTEVLISVTAIGKWK